MDKIWDLPPSEVKNSSKFSKKLKKKQKKMDPRKISIQALSGIYKKIDYI